jgi:hypothetical protein
MHHGKLDVGQSAIAMNRPNIAASATVNLPEASSVVSETEIIVIAAFIGGLEAELIESQRDTDMKVQHRLFA